VYWNIDAGMEYPAGAHRGLGFKSDERGMEGIPIIEDGNGELRAGLLG
jgi:hypothetical protein